MPHALAKGGLPELLGSVQQGAQNSRLSVAGKNLCPKEHLFPSSCPKALRTALESRHPQREAVYWWPDKRRGATGIRGTWPYHSEEVHYKGLFAFSSPNSKTKR